MDYREQCISQQLISANSSLQEFYYPCPNRHDWFFRTLPCRNNVLVIHRLFFLQNVTKSFYQESVGTWAFPGDAPFAQVDGFVFKVFEEEQKTEHHFCSLTVKPPKAEFLPLPPGHPPARPVDHCPHGGTYPSLLPPGHSSPLWPAACLCFPFHTCAGDLSENQCKVGKKVAPLCWVPLVARVPARFSHGPLDDEELRTGTFPCQLAVVRAHLLTSRL